MAKVSRCKEVDQKMIDAVYAAFGQKAPDIAVCESIVLEFTAGSIKITEKKWVVGP